MSNDISGFILESSNFQASTCLYIFWSPLSIDPCMNTASVYPRFSHHHSTEQVTPKTKRDHHCHQQSCSLWQNEEQVHPRHLKTPSSTTIAQWLQIFNHKYANYILLWGWWTLQKVTNIFDQKTDSNDSLSLIKRVGLAILQYYNVTIQTTKNYFLTLKFKCNNSNSNYNIKRFDSNYYCSVNLLKNDLRLDFSTELQDTWPTIQNNYLTQFTHHHSKNKYANYTSKNNKFTKYKHSYT